MDSAEQSPKSWDRQETESARAYQAFFEYAKMGPNRSLAKVCEKLKKNRRTVEKWSSEWSWTKRALEYDADLRRIEVEEQREAVRKMAKENILIAQTIKKKSLQALIDLDVSLITPNVLLSYLVQGVELERKTRMEWLEFERRAEELKAGEDEGGGINIYLPVKDPEPEE